MFRFSTLALLFTFTSAKLGSPSSLEDKSTDDRNLQSQHIGRFQVTVTNMAFQQPMSRFFASVHGAAAVPLYTIGQPATEALALLAENGDPQPLVDFYSREETQGVGDAAIVTDGALVPGQPRSFIVPTSFAFPFVSFASMAINTNDCFVGVSGILLQDNLKLTVPGLDAGSEENNELCSSIPGPACANITAANVRSGNGEGFVHVHRGFFGIGPDLSQAGYDWRNPMLQIEVKRLN